MNRLTHKTKVVSVIQLHILHLPEIKANFQANKQVSQI